VFPAKAQREQRRKETFETRQRFAFFAPLREKNLSP